ncbi:N-acetylmuramoyl-L-alanine amidase [Desulfocucumis palustris]|uniref:N-acetylmuramoyl-L-alanine amidase n=1 Tax=Desulfocucumis palustris TaxID=1898651 RepID=A0A2L2X6Y6_9FIRM|nr:N-acetylmuramoyl-L-alanine amidase CwlD [Desulfocucumis palustris]GBF31925.1 N-acetylmuramoyl-L-alanine amidase [Desulfocucumis palustris]
MPKSRRISRKAAILLAAGLFGLFIYIIFEAVPGVIEKRSIETLSRVMVYKTVVVDPGHGGIDPGAIGQGGALEKDITLDVSKKLADILIQSGATVILTRDTDNMLYDPGTSGLLAKKRQDLSRRVNIANESKADAFISIHVNSFKSDSSQHGAQTFSQPGFEESKKLSQCIQAEMTHMLKNTKRKPKEVAGYFTNKKTEMPSVIVEIGFVSNPKEEKLLVDPGYQTKVAFSIYAGIVKYFAGQIN